MPCMNSPSLEKGVLGTMTSMHKRFRSGVSTCDIMPGCAILTLVFLKLHSLFNQAITKAKKYYLERDVCFQTNVLRDDGEIMQSLVVRDSKCHYLAMPKLPTHRIKTGSNPKNAYARIKFKVRSRWYDPVDVATMGGMLDMNAGHHFEVGYEIAKGSLVVPESEVLTARALLRVAPEHIEVPSMVFVYLPDDSTETYNFIKFLSHFAFGVNTQCSIQSTFSSQRNQMQ
jgi:hypothetical protein